MHPVPIWTIDSHVWAVTHVPLSQAVRGSAVIVIKGRCGRAAPTPSTLQLRRERAGLGLPKGPSPDRPPLCPHHDHCMDGSRALIHSECPCTQAVPCCHMGLREGRQSAWLAMSLIHSARSPDLQKTPAAWSRACTNHPRNPAASRHGCQPLPGPQRRYCTSLQVISDQASRECCLQGGRGPSGDRLGAGCMAGLLAPLSFPGPA